MNFAHPQLVFFILPVGLFLARFLWDRRRERWSRMAADRALLEQTVPRRLLRRRYARSAVLLSVGCGLCLSVALLRPQYGLRWVDRPSAQTDIVIALDVSNSMRVQDTPPSRFERARREIIDLLDQLRGCRLGLVTFAGVSFLELPLTRDLSTFRLFLESVSLDLMPVQGTNLAAALEKGRDALRRGSGDEASAARHRTIVVVTDGEDFGPGIEEVRGELERDGIELIVLGIGTAEGGPIPLGQGYKKERGTLVISRLRPETLRTLTPLFMQAGPGGDDTRWIVARLLSQGEKTGEKGPSKEGVDREQVANEAFQIPLLLGILMLLALHIHHGAGRLAVILLLFLCAPAGASDIERAGARGKKAYEEGEFDRALEHFSADVRDPRVKLGRGSAFYRLERFEEASKEFLAGAEEQENSIERAASLYNAGNGYVQARRYEDAIRIYEESLRLNPNDTDARDNLEYAKRLLQREQPKEQKPEKEQPRQNSSRDSKRESGKGEGEPEKGSQEGGAPADSAESEKTPASAESQPSKENTNESPKEGEHSAGEREKNIGGEKPSGPKGESHPEKQPGDGKQDPPPTGGAPEAAAADRGEAGQEARGERSDPLLDSISEDRGALLDYRKRKAAEELESQRYPGKEW